MALKTIVTLVLISCTLAARMDLESSRRGDLENSIDEDGNANLSLGPGPGSTECNACLEPCQKMKDPKGDTTEEWQQRVAKGNCLSKCVTGGAGLPVGPCREPPGTVTVSDMFKDPRVITDGKPRQIFQPRDNQLAWLKLLKGNGDSYIQRGSFAFALKQINFEDHVIVLMFKENDKQATQFFVDGPEYADKLLRQVNANPTLFDKEKRPDGKAVAWIQGQPCDHENPAECCCQYQDRKFVTGYFYDRKHGHSDCTGQHIDDCGAGLNPMPGMIFGW